MITQSQCDVCAVNLKDVQAAVCEMIDSKPEIVSLEPMALADIWSDIQTVAQALNDPEAGQRLVKSLQERLQRVVTTVPESKARPSVVLHRVAGTADAGRQLDSRTGRTRQVASHC